MIKKTLRIALITIFAALVVLVLLCARFVYSVTRPNSLSANGVDYTLASGRGLKNIANDLRRLHVISSYRDFLILARLKNASHRLQAGEYHFVSGQNSVDVLQQLIDGRVAQHTFAIIDGWTFKKAQQQMAQNPRIKITLAGLNDQQICAQLKIPAPAPEGLFFPDTYGFIGKTTDAELLTRANQNLMQRLTVLWPARDPDLQYQTPYTALIVASLIQKETSIDREKYLIAGVINNRLRTNMPLQIDAAVIYGLQKNSDKPLTKDDLHTDTPYNTYLHRGLPPTPIAMVSHSSLVAALHPTKTDYLYFVANGKGGHEFSATLPQQNIAVGQYREDQKIKELLAKERFPNCESPQHPSQTLNLLKACAQQKKVPHEKEGNAHHR